MTEAQHQGLADGRIGVHGSIGVGAPLKWAIGPPAGLWINQVVNLYIQNSYINT